METIYVFYTEEKPLVTKRAYNYRSSLRKLKKSLTFFYGIRKTKKSLRKLFIHRPHKALSFMRNTQHVQAYLEKRIDVLCYRSGLVECITQARSFIRKKQVFSMFPKKSKNSFSHKVLRFPHTQIPLFSFFKFSPKIASRFKIKLRNDLRSKNKLYALAPSWIILIIPLS